MKKAFLAALLASGLFLAACEPVTPVSSSSETPDSSETVVSSSEEPTTSSEAPTTSSEESTSSEEPTPGHTKVDVFELEDGNLGYNGADTMVAGETAYWAGDGGSVSSATVSNGKVTMVYTGSTWAFYGVQFFYKAPYFNVAEVSYKVSMTINSSVTGPITINNGTVELIANADVEYTGTLTPAAGGATISMQLGRAGDPGTPLSPGAAATITLDNISVIDETSTYYEVSFVDDDGTALDKINAMKGQPLWTTPTVTPESGSIFDGWALEDGTKIDLATYTPTGDVTLKATYAEADLDVNFYVGSEIVHTIKSYEGAKITAPTLGYDEYGFGYGIDAWYTDSNLTTKYDFATGTVGATGLNLYAKLKIQFSDVYQFEGSWDMSTFSWDEDGALILSGDNGGWGALWHKQINFQPLPVGTSGTTYTVSFEYKANAAFHCQIWDNTGNFSASDMNLTANNTEWQRGSLTWNGGTISGNTKLSFELGTFNEGGTNELSIRNIAITPAI